MTTSEEIAHLEPTLKLNQSIDDGPFSQEKLYLIKAAVHPFQGTQRIQKLVIEQHFIGQKFGVISFLLIYFLVMLLAFGFLYYIMRNSS